MTDVTEHKQPEDARLVFCDCCGLPTGEALSPVEVPTEQFCTDCRDLPQPWKVDGEETHTTGIRDNGLRWAATAMTHRRQQRQTALGFPGGRVPRHARYPAPVVDGRQEIAFLDLAEGMRIEFAHEETGERLTGVVTHPPYDDPDDDEAEAGVRRDDDGEHWYIYEANNGPFFRLDARPAPGETVAFEALAPGMRVEFAHELNGTIRVTGTVVETGRIRRDDGQRGGGADGTWITTAGNGPFTLLDQTAAPFTFVATDPYDEPDDEPDDEPEDERPRCACGNREFRVHYDVTLVNGDNDDYDDTQLWLERHDIEVVQIVCTECATRYHGDWDWG